ncbi:hypothetical protein HPB47_024414 [Ixodes persulcatus]|uniref:Uncharacterized protein n=1 Tax=Ixodes persulcatus TaxID=34615 RepID=A0AC60Q5J0_IXOPE|nr:hypothetical protein HPB47_024414 [Ixodes persulcatus]
MLVKCVFAVIRWMQTVNEFLLTSLFSVIHRTPKPLPPITDELLLRSATSLAAQIRTGQLKSAVLVERYMARLRAVQPVINAVVEDRFEEAMDEARAADRLVASGEVSREQLAREKPFLGVPLTTKDCYAVKGGATPPVVTGRRRQDVSFLKPSRTQLQAFCPWQFDDGAIECPVADLEREDLVAQSIKETFLGEPGRQRTAFAVARTRNTHVRSGEVCFGVSPQRGGSHVALLSSVVRRSTFSISAATSSGDLPGYVSR